MSLLPFNSEKIVNQPKAVWAVFFASIIAFMGIGLVDPILPVISNQLGASPSEVTLLFTSYTAVMAVTMLFTGFITNKIGIKRTLLLGAVIVALFSTLAGLSNNVWTIVGLRGGWGLGNAFLVATALTALVTLSKKGSAKAVIMYEAAMGLGFSMGPLLGGLLGEISWRGPFLGVGVLMAVAFISLITLMPKLKEHKTQTTVKSSPSLLDPFRAMNNHAIVTFGIIGFLYNFGFFTLLSYAPFVMGLDAYGIGLVFLGWGILLAITSIFVAPKLQHKFGTIRSMSVILTLFAVLLLIMGIWVSTQWVIIVSIILSGAFIGNNNTLITTGVMHASAIDSSTVSAAYSFLRFIGAAIAPALAGILSVIFSPHIPFIVGGFFVIGAVIFLLLNRKHIQHVDKTEEKSGSFVLKVKNYMNQDVISVQSTMIIKDLLKLFVEHRIDNVPVVDSHKKLIGMISEGDLIRYFAPKDEFFSDFIFTLIIEKRETEQEVLKEKFNKIVADIMHKQPLYTVKENDKSEKAIHIFSQHHFKQLPVLNLEGRVVGLISRGDIINTILKNND